MDGVGSPLGVDVFPRKDIARDDEAEYQGGRETYAAGRRNDHPACGHWPRCYSRGHFTGGVWGGYPCLGRPCRGDQIRYRHQRTRVVRSPEDARNLVSPIMLP